jgi:hypothetical protein
MAKPDKPLLSLGARGTIADSLTFQKRGKGKATIARQKPIPKDPKSEAQLAQRQIYRDAVAVWHALTPEEKEAWRGVCPGLTAYQCFMRSELRKVVPPPEEYTEEQIAYNNTLLLQSGSYIKAGQRLFISNREVTKLGFWIYRAAAPTGDVTFEIHRVSDDSLISSKIWGLIQDLPTVATYEEVEFDDPQIINEEVRICAHFPGGGGGSALRVCFQTTDVKADECFTLYKTPPWNHWTASDAAYRYKYYLP